MASEFLQKLYWSMPYFVKCWMATRHGRKSGKARFGGEYDRVLAEIAGRDSWSLDQFQAYQLEQMRIRVTDAAAYVPFYRALFAKHGLDAASIQTVEDLRQIPILDKQTVREDPVAFVDERLDVATLVKGHTSGTTGTPLDCYRTVRQEAVAFAFADARHHDVAGVRRRRNRSVSLGGHLVASPTRAMPPFWVLNRAWNQLYMSSYHLSPEYLGHYVDAIRKYRPEYIEGYPSSVYAIAQYMVDTGCEPIPMAAAFTTAENLFDHQRDAIAKAFCCRAFSQYGCGEQAAFAAECEVGSMHLSPEIALIEVLDEDGRPVAPGETGQLIGTSLVNEAQPFIRYRVGDRVALGTEPCPCGRTLPVLDHVEGRIDAVLFTRDGRRVGRLDPVFKGAEGIAEAQIVQDDLDHFRIRVVPAANYTEADGKVLIENLSQRTGPADIRVELVDTIERTPAGKFRAVVCNLPDEQRPA